MFYDLRYLIDTIYILPGALNWYGYDAFSFLRITSLAQMEAVIQLGIAAGTLSWFLATILSHFFFYTGGVRNSARSAFFLDVVIKGPIQEELIFRFIGISAIYQLTGSLALAVLLSSLAFSVIHMGWGDFRLPDTFVSGLLFATIFLWGGLPAAIIAHMTHNLIAVLLWFV